MDGIIIPGGESTVIGKLLRELDILEDLKNMINDGMPVFGTCAGMIILADKIENDEKIQQKMELTKSHPLYEDIHQIAGDIRFLKNLIIVGLVLGVVLILIGVFAMI